MDVSKILFWGLKGNLQVVRIAVYGRLTRGCPIPSRQNSLLSELQLCEVGRLFRLETEQRFIPSQGRELGVVEVFIIIV